MCGVLEKSQFGASQYGFVHCCYEVRRGPHCRCNTCVVGVFFVCYKVVEDMVVALRCALYTIIYKLCGLWINLLP